MGIIFGLLCVLFFGIPSTGQDRNHTIQYQSVNHQGLDVHFRVFGSGTPLFIIGGGPGDHPDRYITLCKGFTEGIQVILVDQRGTGKTIPRPSDSSTISVAQTLGDFEAIRRHLGMDQWSVLGFSYGGFIASQYAETHPTSVASLVLLESMGLDTNAFTYFMDNIRSRLSPADLQVVEYWNDPARMKADSHHAIVERIRAMMPGYFYDRQKSLIVSQAMKDSDFNFEMGQWIWKDIRDNHLELTAEHSVYQNPVLILHGRQDPLGESVPLRLKNFYTGSRMKIIEKCGHYAWVEQPEEVYSSISDFIAPHHP